jgi:hypothetical protein
MAVLHRHPKHQRLVAHPGCPQLQIRPLRRPDGEVVSPPHGHKAPRGARFPRSAHARYGGKGRPLYPGTSGAHANQVQSPARRLPPPHGTARVLYPGVTAAYPGHCLTRHQSRVHVIRPPGLPLTRGPPATGGLLRLSPGLRTRTGRTRTRTPGRGQALSTSPELHRWPTCQPSNLRVHSQHVRHRVAPAFAGLSG